VGKKKFLNKIILDFLENSSNIVKKVWKHSKYIKKKKMKGRGGGIKMKLSSCKLCNTCV